jgi:hypothetical protein
VPPDALNVAPDGGADVDLGVARTVPLDPRVGPDSALSIAYQIVTGVFARRAAASPAARSAPTPATSAGPATSAVPAPSAKPAAPAPTTK